jgi:uncharacterized protein
MSMNERSPQPTEPLLNATAALACWRCGKPVDAACARCSWCAAPLAADGPTQPAAPQATADRRLLQTLAVFAALLAISVLHGLFLGLCQMCEAVPRELTSAEILGPMVVTEIVDTVLVLAALYWIRIPSANGVTPARRWGTWGLALPLLAVLLAVNVGYHWAVRTLLHVEVAEDRVFDQPELLPVWITAICIQPAVIEELFFRYLALGILRSVVTAPTAVALSAVMFGLAHVGVPLSIPMLIVLGLGLGYLRVASGSMALPMLVHLLHNAAVLCLTYIMG